LVLQLALDGGAVGLRGTAAKLFDVEGGHMVRRLEGILKHRYQGSGTSDRETVGRNWVGKARTCV
jgi:hypothetical protein